MTYCVSQKSFFGVQAKNVMTIIFVLCDAAVQTEADWSESIIKYTQAFSARFGVDNVTVSKRRGAFCANSQRRRRLLQSGDDEEVTVVVIFADAEDATFASEDAYEGAIAINSGVAEGSCTVSVCTFAAVNSYSNLNTVDEAEERRA